MLSNNKEIFKNRNDNRFRLFVNVWLLNASFIDNLRLGNGKMGIAIFFYNYARYIGSKVFEDYAGELIDEIYEEINTNTPLDFANELIGMVWGIEYLERNGFIKGDTDAILKEIDVVISKRLNEYLPKVRVAKKMEIGYNKYLLAMSKSKSWDEGKLFSLIRKQSFINDQFNTTILINTGNYGLFGGIAGEALMTLRELSKK